MIEFREAVHRVLKETCNNAYTTNGYKLDTADEDYGETKLVELGITPGIIADMCYAIANRTGMVIGSEISRLWVTISDIEKTLEAFFTTKQVGTA